MSHTRFLVIAPRWVAGWLCTVTASLPLSFYLLSPGASVAQVVYGNGPSSPYNSPQFAPSNQSYTLQTEVACPTPSFNITAFAGKADDWANNSIPYASSNSGVGNYGVAVGFSAPLGGDLSEFCSKFAALKTTFERQKVETQLLISQLALLKQCKWFIDQGYNLDDPVFHGDGVLSTIGQCKPLAKVLNDPNRKPRISGPEAQQEPDPPTPVQPLSPQPTLVFPVPSR